MMSKQQRLYYEYANKERVRQELIEFVKQQQEMEKNKFPHQIVYEKFY